LWNSLASEPRGNAGTAEVLLPRADAAPSGEWVTRADALLAIARAETAPTTRVFFDRSKWAHTRSTRPSPNQSRQDADMTLKELLEAAGKKPADMAEFLGVDESQVAPLIEAAPAPAAEGEAPPAPAGEAPPSVPPAPAAETVPVTVGDKQFAVPPEVAAELAAMAEQVATETARADAESKKASAAVARAKQAETAAQQRQDALVNMVSKAEAEKMVSTRAMDIAKTIALAFRAQAPDWQPEERQDAEGNAREYTARDWERLVIAAAFGDEIATADCNRYDAKSPAVADELYTERVSQARAVIEARPQPISAKGRAVLRAVEGNRDATNEHRADAMRDEIQEAKAAAEAAAKNYLGAPKPIANAEGAR
jgi:hypothetical protein